MARKRDAQKGAGALVPSKSIDRMQPRGIAICDEAMIRELCDGISKHPSLATTCRGAGVAPRVVQDWIRRGTMPGCNPVLEDFATRFLKADADHASHLYTSALDFTFTGQTNDLPRAKMLFGECHIRYRIQDDLQAFIDQARKPTDDLHSLLSRPTQRLKAALERAGWVRKDTFDAAGESVEDD